MNNSMLAPNEFINLCYLNGYKNLQEIADEFNDGKSDSIRRWSCGKTSHISTISKIGLYAIAKDRGWLDRKT